MSNDVIIDRIYFCINNNKTFTGFGTLNNKVLYICSDVDGLKPKNSVMLMKIIDYTLYKKYIEVMFRVNQLATVVYITRTDQDSLADDTLYITREEHDVLKQEFRSKKH